ncbi:MAG: cell division protein FtsA [Parcubacteria group bacterium]
MSKYTVCGIDIGNSSVKTVIADMNTETGRPRIIGIGNAQSNGLRRGIVVDMEEVIKSIKQSVSQAERMSGGSVDRAYVSISGPYIKTQLSRGVVAVSRADGEISQNDIDRVVEAASTVSLPQNYEIIHIIPKNFIIDGAEVVKNPLGMKGIRLEVEVLLIEGLSPYIHNLTKAVQNNGVEIAELIYSPLAASKSMLDKHQREYGVLLLDLGGGVTSMALFHEGDLMHTAILPVGAKHVTNDLAIAFRTSIDNAELIKNTHGFIGTAEKNNKKENIDLSDITQNEDMTVPRKHIAKIIDARIGELFDVIDAELKKTPGIKVLPAGVVLAGGGANLAGIDVFAKNRLGLSAKIGGSYFMEGLSEAVIDPAFAVAVGLVVWGFEEEDHPRRSLAGGTSNILKRAGKWFKNFLP